VFGFFGAKSVNDNLGFQIPNLDGIVSGGTQPVTVGRKDEAIDNVTGIETVKAFALVQVPKHGSVVLTTRSGQRAIGGNTDSVEVSGVSDKVVAELAVGEVPDLDETIPSGRHNEWDRLGRREANARDPFGVSLGFTADLVLALSEGVPQTDGGVTRSCSVSSLNRRE
jgi:hypothetical protein